MGVQSRRPRQLGCSWVCYKRLWFCKLWCGCGWGLEEVAELQNFIGGEGGGLWWRLWKWWWWCRGSCLLVVWYDRVVGWMWVCVRVWVCWWSWCGSWIVVGMWGGGEMWAVLMLVVVWGSCPSLLVGSGVLVLVGGVSGPSLWLVWWWSWSVMWCSGSNNLQNLLVCLCCWSIQPYSRFIYQPSAPWVGKDHHIASVYYL